jgi:YHS domain-containing protein
MIEGRADDVERGLDVNGHGSRRDEPAIKTIKLPTGRAAGGRSGLWRLRVLVASAVALVGAAVLVPVAASAAVPIALVQESSNATVGSNSLTLTLSNPVQAGDALVASFENSHDGLTVTSISGGGVSWQQANIENADAYEIADSEIWYGLSSTGGPATVTVNLSGITSSVFYVLNVSEWSGVGGLDQAPPGTFDNVGSTPALAPSITPSTSGDLFIGVIGASGPAVVSGAPGGGFSAFPVPAGVGHTSFGYLVATDSSPHQYSQPLTGAGLWCGTAASFYPASGSSPQGVYAADSFGRTVSDGWGNADTGGPWTLQKGAAADESVNGSSGVFSVPSDVFTNSEQVLDLPSTSALDYEGSFDVTWMEDVNAEGAAYGGELAGLVARFQNTSATGYYRMSAVWDAGTGHIALRIQNACGGLSTCNNFELDTDTGIDPTQDFPGGPYGPYHVKVEIVGSDPTSFAMKIWKAGTAEPADWMLTTTDTDDFGPQVPGPIGFRGSDDLEDSSGNYLADYTSHVEINNLFVGPVPAPAVASLNQTSGPIGGGTSVTISGANFFGATAVDFGGQAASSFTVNGDESITAVSPPGTAGPVDVTVTTPGGISTINSGDQFTYQTFSAPTVTGVDPPGGLTTGGTTVTVTGTNLSGATAVDFGTAPATNVTVNSSTSLTATSPPEPSGTIGFVQSSSTETATGSNETLTLPAEVTPGDGLVLLFSNVTDGVTVSSVTGGGVTWQQANVENDDQTADSEIWYGLGSSGGAGTQAITVGLSGTAAKAYPLSVSEWSGIGGLDQAPAGISNDTVGSSVAEAPSITPTQSDDLFVAAVGANAATTGSPGGGFSALSNGGATHIAFGSLVATDSASHQFTQTLTQSTEWSGIAAAFFPAAAPTVDVVNVTVTTPGGTSAISSADQFTYGLSVTVPGAPTGVSATPGNAQATVVFTPPVNNGGSTITGYTVTATDTTNSANGGQTASGTSSPITVTGLTNGDSYTFSVVATNSAGNSVPSAASSPVIPVTVPGAPTGLGATPGNTTVALKWTVPTSNGGSPITGYNVYEGTRSGGESTTPVNRTTLITTTGYTVTGLTNGTTYYFTVEAVNALGSSAASNQASATPATVPGAPTGLSATRGNTTVALSWRAPSSNGGSAITGYNVYEGTTSGGESTVAVNTSPVTGPSYTANGLTNGTTYYFTVKAVNAAGSSAASNQASATPATVPGAPTGLSATRGNTTVALKWTAPTSNGGSPVTGYYVYLGTKSGGESTTPLNFTPLTTTSCTVGGLSNGTTYYFTVKAVNAVGVSAASNEASATTPATAPAAPTGLSATPGNTTVALKWTAPTSNGGSPVTGYNVYEGTSSGHESTTPVNGATLITATSYTVSGLSNGTTYYFTVEAVNAAGSSAASNQASVVAGAPVAVADQYSTTFNATLTVSAPGVLANDILNGATIVSHTNPAHGTLTLNANGSFTYSPSFFFFGTDSFTYKLQNAYGSSVATVTIKVNI